MNDSRHKPDPFTTLSSQVVWSCPWYSVRQDQIRLPNGQQGQYNVVQHDGAVWVVPVTNDGELLLLMHFRYTVNAWCWELPAGGIKEGKTALEIAREELREETGGVAEHWEYLGQFYTSNGISNEVAHIFLARGVSVFETAHEPAEVMEVHRLPLTEAIRMARANKISDGPSALAILLSEARLKEIVADLASHDEEDN